MRLSGLSDVFYGLDRAGKGGVDRSTGNGAEGAAPQHAPAGAADRLGHRQQLIQGGGALIEERAECIFQGGAQVGRETGGL